MKEYWIEVLMVTAISSVVMYGLAIFLNHEYERGRPQRDKINKECLDRDGEWIDLGKSGRICFKKGAVLIK